MCDYYFFVIIYIYYYLYCIAKQQGREGGDQKHAGYREGRESGRKRDEIGRDEKRGTIKRLGT